MVFLLIAILLSLVCSYIWYHVTRLYIMMSRFHAADAPPGDITQGELTFILLGSPISLALLLYAILFISLVIQDLTRRTTKKTVLEKVTFILLPLLVSISLYVVLFGEVNRGVL